MHAHVHNIFLQGGAHPNIASLVGMTTQGGPTCLLLEYVPHGTLEDFLTSLFEGPSPDWYIKFTKDTLRGAYHKHVSGDLMNIIVQVADGMVRSLVQFVDLHNITFYFMHRIT